MILVTEKMVPIWAYFGSFSHFGDTNQLQTYLNILSKLDNIVLIKAIVQKMNDDISKLE